MRSKINKNNLIQHIYYSHLHFNKSSLFIGSKLYSYLLKYPFFLYLISLINLSKLTLLLSPFSQFFTFPFEEMTNLNSKSERFSILISYDFYLFYS